MPPPPEDADSLADWDVDPDPLPAPAPPAPAGQQRTGTMPPPELFDRTAPSSARELVLTRAEESLADAARVRAPISRRTLAEAEEAKLRSAILFAVATGDAEAEHRTAGALARLLASRGIFLEEAIDLARRSLAVGDDPALRAELAGWLAGLGEPGLAAAALLELSRRADAESAPARTLVKVGILLARSGDPGGALDVWTRAAEADPTDATALELVGMAEAWCPDDCDPNEALAAYLEAARRRAAAGDAEGAHQDRLRALQVAEQPGMELSGGEIAVRELARELRAGGKQEAADELLRTLALRLAASDEARARTVHEERLSSAVEEGAFVRASAAAIDGGLLGATERTGTLVERALRGAGLDALARARSGGDDALAPLFDPAAEPSARARALAAMGSEVGGPSGAVLLAIAAEIEAAQGAAELARGHARDAFGHDSTSLRALVVLSDLLGREGGRATANLIEQASRRGAMRIRTCLRLADVLREAGDGDASVAWVQRALALRPGDGRLIERLVEGATERGSLAKLEEVILWTLAQPRPAGDVTPSLLAALARVLDLERGSVPEGAALPTFGTLARRTLDVLGPKRADVREGLRGLAESAGDVELLASLLERCVAVETNDESARAALLALASLREQGGDFDGAIRELYRALAREADPAEIRERVYGSDEARMDAGVELGSDAEIARAAILAATAPTGPGPVEALEGSEAYRTLAAVVYDAAGDADGADASLLRADALSREAGVSRYAQDLAQLLGAATAAERIRVRVEAVAAAEDADEEERKQHASLALQSAQVSCDAGMFDSGLVLAQLALSLQPTRADVLAMIERCAEHTGDLAAVDAAYSAAAAAALGCYGRRAAHYRAARLLERNGDLEAALRHAIQSFEAVPTEGQGFQMVVRLSAQSGEPAEAARAIARVADGMQGDQRVLWLLRAAQTTSDSEDGLRTKVDVLLRALAIRADSLLVRELGGAVEKLAARDADLEVERMRFARSCDSVLAKAEGPDGARAGVELARVAALAFADAPTAVGALERAMGADGDIDEYAELVPLVPRLVADRASGEKLLGLVIAQVAQPYASIGGALLRLAARLAEELEDREARARFLVEAARRVSEDANLVVQAFDVVRAFAGTPLGDELAKGFARVQASDRFEALSALAHTLAGDGDGEGAAAAIDEAAKAAPRDEAERDVWLDRVAALASHADSHVEAALERALEAEVKKRKDAKGAARPGKLLAGRVARRGDVNRALELLVALADKGVPTDTLGPEVADVARAMTEKGAGELQVGGNDTPGRMALLRMLADALRDTGSPVSLEAYKKVVEHAPEDPAALEGLEQAAVAVGDYATVASLLDKKLERAKDASSRRALRLRRAAILEQRLDRATDARAVLRQQLAETPDDAGAMRFLADLLEKANEPQAAGELWSRLAELTSSVDERADYGLRVVRCFLSAGNLPAAEERLTSIATFAPREQVLELRVDIARRIGDPAQLADALEELAAASQAPAENRALHLVGAAEANLVAERFDLAPEQLVRALRLAPHDGRVVVGAHRVAYLLRGDAGQEAEAKQTVADLVRVTDSVPAAEAEVHAFLLAEALDASGGAAKNAGERELAKRHAAVGPAPLIVAGLGERLARTERRTEALVLLERALEGDLRGLRTPSQLAYQAADLAAFLGDRKKATALFERAAADAELASLVERRLAELGWGPPPKTPPPEAPRPLASPEPRPEPAPRAEPKPEPARAEPKPEPAEPAAKPEPARAEPKPEPAEPAAKPEPARAEPKPEPPRAEPPRVAPATAAPAVASGRPRSLPPEAFLETDDVLSVDEGELVPSSEQPGSGPRVTSPKSDISELAPAALPSPAVEVPAGVNEASLFRELVGGSYEAGEKLVALYGRDLARHARELVALRRQQAILRPGDHGTLVRLHDAARLDGNGALASAVEHVLRGFGGGGGLDAPPIAVQQPPELVNALLYRDISVPIFEALALVWDSGLYKRDLAHYALTGVERVQPGPGTPAGETLGEVARALGLTRPSLYYHREAGPLRGSVTLIQPPAAVFRGELREDPREMRYAMGAMLGATAPEYVLAIALPEDQGEMLVGALLAAFGPVDQAPASRSPSVVRLEQSLWQLMPKRSERRLREIAADPTSFRFDLAAVGARQAMRRAGLFASGDLPTAVRMTMAELGMDADLPFASEDGLARACAQHPEVSDLVVLATGLEYAEARWAGRR